jgi:glucose/arabinose dehydrogenase
MFRTTVIAAGLGLAVAAAHAEQLSNDPFSTPIEAAQGVIGVSFVEFATIPDADNGDAPRMMHMVDEPGTKRLFVSTMRGALYGVSYDGKKVTPYLDVNAANWNVGVQSAGSERGLQSFAFHPQFARRGAPGYGKFYTYTDTTNTSGQADFAPTGSGRSHDTVLLEWTAKDAGAATYDGGAPKEVFRVAHPFPNHNGGQIGFNPQASSAEAGLLYVGFADGGSGGDPMNMAQNLASAFGKILRIDPLGSNSKNGRYGIPAANPFAGDGKDDTLGEIYAYGLRNPQRFGWDPKDGRMFVADIGQNQVEEVSPVPAGGNLGWNKWEASYKFVRRQVDVENPRSEAGMVWPVVEFDHRDPILQGLVAVTGVGVYRDSAIKQLRNLLIFGDNPSGEIFYVSADNLPNGGHGAIRRIMLNDGGTNKTLLQLINAKNAARGKSNASRADLRFGFGPKQEIFLLNKRDGIIRMLVPDGAKSGRVGA